MCPQVRLAALHATAVNNYPPGVSGNEPDIVGADEVDTDVPCPSADCAGTLTLTGERRYRWHYCHTCGYLSDVWHETDERGE